jgi:hypothetical protein
MIPRGGPPRRIGAVLPEFGGNARLEAIGGVLARRRAA